MCAMSLAFGVSSALLRRERTGRGGSIDTSLLQAAMTLANNQLIRVEDTDAPVHDKALQTLAQQREAHVPFADQAEALPSARSSPMLKVYFRTFATTDLDIAVACGSHRLRQNFMQALELEDTALDSISSRGQAEFEQHYLALQEEVENKLRSQSSAFWVARLADHGVPVSQVKFPIELFDDEHVEQNGFLHTLDHPTVGGIRVVAPPVRIDGDGFAPVVPTAPFATETQALLLQLGFSEAEVELLLARGVTVSEPG
jgi:crotonobetainyl-CoA:carnitine CoA-transferase CaiB-like acyl-CoA transferase